MNNLNLALTLQLKDQLVGPLQRAYADVGRKLDEFEKVVGKLGATGDQSAQKLTNLASKSDALGRVQGGGKLKSDLAGVGDAAEDAHRKTGKLANMLEKLPGLARQASTAMVGVEAARRVIAVPVSAFANLEDANTALRVTMMTKGGRVSQNYGAIQKIAVGLGNQLPGTTRDFITAANELLSLGVSEKAVVNGGLVSAANLGVVLKLPQQQAAATVAKMREAYGLRDDELPGMADEIQRNRFAFGMQPTDLLLAAKYSAPTLSTLGLSGRTNMSEILTLQGMANLKGMDGSQFGTNFDMMLQRLAKGPLMLQEAKKGMKAEARSLMDKAGIDFNFYDAKGKLKTEDGSAVKGMLRELEKLEQIRLKLGDKAAMEVSGAVFGQEAARPAQILAQYGVKGFEEARERVANQATLQERTAESLTTLQSKAEALAGTFENLNANAAKQMGEGAKPGLEFMNDLLGKTSNFVQDNPGAGTVGIVGAATAMGLAAWKASGSLWERFIGAGAGAPGAAVAGGSGAMGQLLSIGGKMLGPLMLLESLTQPSEEDIAILRAQDRMAQGYRGKGFRDPRRVDGGGVPDGAMQANAQATLTMMSPILSRMEALSNRPVVLLVDGNVLAESLNKRNSRSADRY